MIWPGIVFAATVIVAQPLVDADVLEPSVENEVAHALARAPSGVAAPCSNAVVRIAFETAYPFAGVSVSDRAIRLVSAQRADGRWLCGTNDVTVLAVAALREMLPAEQNETPVGKGSGNGK